MTTEHPAFRNGGTATAAARNTETPNINAYDWNSNHLWNIADIVEDVHMMYFGASLTTAALWKDIREFDPTLFAGEETLFAAHADGAVFLIDLKTKRVVQTLHGFK